MSQKEFWNLPQVKQCQEVQKANPYGSSAHKAAFTQITELLVSEAGFSQKDAIEYMGEY